jgi:hypothetical protein
LKEEAARLTVIGLLNAAHRRTGTFDIDLGKEGMINGRLIEHDSLDGTLIRNRVGFILAEVITTELIAGNAEASWSLVEKPRELLMFKFIQGLLLERLTDPPNKLATIGR